MKEYFQNLLGIILTSVSGVGNLANIVSFINENKIIFNMFFLTLISIATLIYWIFRIVGKYKKDKIDIAIKTLEFEDRKLSCEERRLELEIKKQLNK